MSTTLPRSVLIVGSGGREHALVKACLASPTRPRVAAAPGNGGIAREATCFPVAADDVPGLVALARREQIAFVVVGPEVPLSLGLVDALADAGIPAYGPKRDGARLEASKIFTKELLLRHGIPTAPAAFFSEAAPALAYLGSHDRPVVVKADGLAAGKGVVVPHDRPEAEAAIRQLLARQPRSNLENQKPKILLEDCLDGEETSLHLIVSGRDFVVLPTSQDHKRVGDGDTGPNTGGMGAYSPAEVVSSALLDEIVRTIARPSVEAIADAGIDFRGTLYIGLMLTADGPKVLEFNTRFGDPETQVILPRLATDPLALMWAAARGRLREVAVAEQPEPVICVVVAARGYPGGHPKGDVIVEPPVASDDAWIVHAGTALDAQRRIVSAGGRVLGVCARGTGLREAADRAYAICDRLQFAAKYFRRDIGARQLNRK